MPSLQVCSGDADSRAVTGDLDARMPGLVEWQRGLRHRARSASLAGAGSGRRWAGSLARVGTPHARSERILVRGDYGRSWAS